MPKTEVVGFAMTVAGVLLAMFLLYLYVFSALTASRNQNQLLHSLTSDPVAIFSLASGHEPRNGQPVAILDIPSIGLHQAVVEGTTAADLQMGPGLVTSKGISGLPGEPGDAVIAGRRVSFGGPFGRLGDLQTGSVIQVVDGAGAFKFEVTKVESIPQGQLAIPSYGRSWLTLVTSNSSWLPTGRMVVARIVGQPASAKGSSSFRESLPSFAGDPAAGVLAGLWALAFIIVLSFMVFAIKRWRQTWVSWLLAAPVLLACGLFACESLARCLPSTL
jgi:sortase A